VAGGGLCHVGWIGGVAVGCSCLGSRRVGFSLAVYIIGAGSRLPEHGKEAIELLLGRGPDRLRGGLVALLACFVLGLDRGRDAAGLGLPVGRGQSLQPTARPSCYGISRLVCTHRRNATGVGCAPWGSQRGTTNRR